MKKEIKNAVITLLVMSAVTLLLLVLLSILAFVLKWQSKMAMQGITFTYISTGLLGGMLRGGLSRRGPVDKKDTLFKTGKIGLGMALLYGIVLASLYWGIPGGIAMLIFKENISDMGRFAIVWSMMAGSITAGILITTGRWKKEKVQKER